MKPLLYLFSSLLLLSITGCKPQGVITTYKAAHLFPTDNQFRHILVVAIVKASRDSIRQNIENFLVADLKSKGYFASSSMAVYGINGLTRLNQEATFQKLCNNGTDAVLTVSLVDKSRDNQYRRNKRNVLPPNFYYDRLWNYESIQANLDTSAIDPKVEYYWESILYDLNKLEPEYVIQTRPFKPGQEERMGKVFIQGIVQRIEKENALNR